MQRFILNQNIELYRTALAREHDGPLRETIVELLARASRNLALLDADQGAGCP